MRIFDVNAVAAILDVRAATVRRWIVQGDLAAFRMGEAGRLFIKSRDVAKALDVTEADLEAMLDGALQAAAVEEDD